MLTELIILIDNFGLEHKQVSLRDIHANISFKFVLVLSHSLGPSCWSSTSPPFWFHNK